MRHDDGVRRVGRRGVLRTGVAAGVALGARWPAVTAQGATVPGENATMLVWSGAREGHWVDPGSWQPDANRPDGPGIVYAPLAYHSAATGKTCLWLADSYAFTPDFRRLTIGIRSGMHWRDGAAFSAGDLARVLNALRHAGPRASWRVDLADAMGEARTTDADRVVIDFRLPSPQFCVFMTYKPDIGVYLVPRQIVRQQDWPDFRRFDIAKA